MRNFAYTKLKTEKRLRRMKMEVIVNTELGTHKYILHSYGDLIKLLIEIDGKLKYQDNDWKEEERTVLQ